VWYAPAATPTTFTHPLAQKYPEAQSWSELHEVSHALGPQAYGVHGVTVPAEHVPAPSHCTAGCSFPLKQVAAAPQGVPAGYSSHAPAPLHTPLVPQLEGPWSAHCPFGFVPAMMGAHVPSGDPVSMWVQAMQLPVHAAVQQKPSAQKPLWHWSAVEHAAPVASLPMQAEPEQ
jgi:hypothetical protein